MPNVENSHKGFLSRFMFAVAGDCCCACVFSVCFQRCAGDWAESAVLGESSHTHLQQVNNQRRLHNLDLDAACCQLIRDPHACPPVLWRSQLRCSESPHLCLHFTWPTLRWTITAYTAPAPTCSSPNKPALLRANTAPPFTCSPL